MKTQNTSHPRWLAILALSLSATSLWAQETPPASDDSPDKNDEIVTLKEFTVTSSSASEYVAAESITGTRIASKIQDLPFAVNVVTSEFIDDFNALEFGEKFAYTSNVIGYETISTGYSVRGFEADVQLRNGFRRIGLIDKVSVDRAEVIKGPAASIYGTTLPGGIVNIVTKKPKAKPEYRLGFTAGSDNLIRAQASATGPAGTSGKLFYRVDVAGEKRDYDMPFKSKEQTTGAVQLLWKPAQNTSVLFEIERLVRNEEGNANVPFAITTGNVDPFRVVTSTGLPITSRVNLYDRLATELLGFNVQGPLNYSRRWVNTATVTLEHRISENISFRSSANWYDRKLERQEVGGRDQYNPVTNRISSANNASFNNSSTSWLPRFRPYGEGGGGWQNDLLFVFETGPVKHKLLVTADYQRQSETPQQFNASSAQLPATILSNGLDVANPNYNYVTYEMDPTAYTSIVEDQNNSLDVYGIFISERATMMDGRLNFLAGMRYDYVDNHAISYAPLAQSNTERQTDDLTYQIGANIRIVDGLTAYANASTSFVPQYGAGINEDGTTFDVPNETGKGWEAGIKAALFESKLNLTASYFDIVRSGILRRTTSSDGFAYDVLSGEEGAKGIELDFNWVVSREFQIFGGYGWTKSEVISHSEARHLIGTSTRRTPEHTLGVGMKYDFKSGALKGLFFTAGYKYNSESLINPSTGRNITITATSSGGTSTTSIVNLRLENGLLLFPDRAENERVTISGLNPDTGQPNTLSVRVPDGREKIYNDAFQTVDAGIGYRWKTSKRYNHRVQFNVTNLLDEVYTFGSAGQGQNTGYSFTYDLRF